MKKLSALVLLGATLCSACGAEEPRTGLTAATTTVAPRTTDAAPTTAPASSQREQPGEAGAGEEDSATPAGTVRAWVEALAQRDADRAWALTHVASRDAFGGRKAFDGAAADLDARYGGWAEATGVRYEATPLPAAGPAVTIVVLQRDGTDAGPTPRALAVPVRQDADGMHQVDPFQDLLPEGHLEHHPQPGSAVPARQAFEVYLVGGREVSLIVDDEVLRVTTESADGDRQHVEGRPAQPLAAGWHTLTVVVERDGALQARAVRYRV